MVEGKGGGAPPPPLYVLFIPIDFSIEIWKLHFPAGSEVLKGNFLDHFGMELSTRVATTVKKRGQGCFLFGERAKRARQY